MTTTTRSREAEAYLDASRATAPDTASACAGFTAHEITAHLAATCAEVTRHLRPYQAGEPVPRTRSFEEREPAYRALGAAALIERLGAEEAEFRDAVQTVLDREPDAVIPWTGRTMAVAKFRTHLRNEFAVHRWDVVGDDALGDELLAQPELTAHAVSELGEILPRFGHDHDPESGRELHVRLRSPGAPDLALDIDVGGAALRLCDAEDRPADAPRLELDAAARVLVIWGRRPDRRDRVRARLDQPTLQRVHTVLAGY